MNNLSSFSLGAYLEEKSRTLSIIALTPRQLWHPYCNCCEWAARQNVKSVWSFDMNLNLVDADAD